MTEVNSNVFEPERVLKPLYDATTLLVVSDEATKTYYAHEEALESLNCIHEMVTAELTKLSYASTNQDDENQPPINQNMNEPRYTLLVTKKLFQWNFVKKDLIPLLLSLPSVSQIYSEHDTDSLKLFCKIMKIAVIMTTPLPVNIDNEFKKEHNANMVGQEQRGRHIKACFCDKTLLGIICAFFQRAILLPASERTKRDATIIDLTLIFISNLLRVPDEISFGSSSGISTNQHMQHLHIEFVTTLDTSKLLEAIFYLIKLTTTKVNKQNQILNLQAVGLLRFLFGDEDPLLLVIQPTSNTKGETLIHPALPASVISFSQAITQEKTNKKKLKQHIAISGRHPRFGGTFLVKDKSGNAKGSMHNIVNQVDTQVRVQFSSEALDPNTRSKAYRPRCRKAGANLGMRSSNNESATTRMRHTADSRILFCSLALTVIQQLYGPLIKRVQYEIDHHSLNLIESDYENFLWMNSFFTSFYYYYSSRIEKDPLLSKLHIKSIHSIEKKLTEVKSLLAADDFALAAQKKFLPPPEDDDDEEYEDKENLNSNRPKDTTEEVVDADSMDLDDLMDQAAESDSEDDVSDVKSVLAVSLSDSLLSMGCDVPPNDGEAALPFIDDPDEETAVALGTDTLTLSRPMISEDAGDTTIDNEPEGMEITPEDVNKTENLSSVPNVPPPSLQLMFTDTLLDEEIIEEPALAAEIIEPSTGENSSAPPPPASLQLVFDEEQTQTQTLDLLDTELQQTESDTQTDNEISPISTQPITVVPKEVVPLVQKTLQLVPRKQIPEERKPEEKPENVENEATIDSDVPAEHEPSLKLQFDSMSIQIPTLSLGDIEIDEFETTENAWESHTVATTESESITSSQYERKHAETKANNSKLWWELMNKETEDENTNSNSVNTRNSLKSIKQSVQKSSFLFVTRRISNYIDEKNWKALETSVACLHSQLLMIDSMFQSKHSTLANDARNLLRDIFFDRERYFIYILPSLLRDYNPSRIPLTSSYLSNLLECIHITIRLMQALNKERAIFTLAKSARHVVEEEENFAVDPSTVDNVDQEVFSPDEYSLLFIHPASIHNLCFLLDTYLSNSANTNHYLAKFFFRICAEHHYEFMFYRISVFRVFERFLYDPRTKKEKRFSELREICSWIVRRFYDASRSNPEYYMAILFANPVRQWKLFIGSMNGKDSEDDFVPVAVRDCVVTRKVNSNHYEQKVIENGKPVTGVWKFSKEIITKRWGTRDDEVLLGLLDDYVDQMDSDPFTLLQSLIGINEKCGEFTEEQIAFRLILLGKFTLTQVMDLAPSFFVTPEEEIQLEPVEPVNTSRSKRPVNRSRNESKELRLSEYIRHMEDDESDEDLQWKNVPVEKFLKKQKTKRKSQKQTGKKRKRRPTVEDLDSDSDSRPVLKKKCLRRLKRVSVAEETPQSLDLDDLFDKSESVEELITFSSDSEQEQYMVDARPPVKSKVVPTVVNEDCGDSEEVLVDLSEEESSTILEINNNSSIVEVSEKEISSQETTNIVPQAPGDDDDEVLMELSGVDDSESSTSVLIDLSESEENSTTSAQPKSKLEETPNHDESSEEVLLDLSSDDELSQ